MYSEFIIDLFDYCQFHCFMNKIRSLRHFMPLKLLIPILVISLLSVVSFAASVSINSTTSQSVQGVVYNVTGGFSAASNGFIVTQSAATATTLPASWANGGTVTTATVIVPKVGLFVLFLKSPQGLIATIGIISLAYLSIHDMKRKEEKKKEKLLAALSKKVINGDLPNEQFGKIELAIRYSDDIESFGIKDPSILAFVGWLKNGGLDQNWKLRNVTCNNCSGIALELRGEKNNSLAICPHCHRVLWNTTMVLTEKIFNKVLLQSIDESLSSLGSASKVNLYSHLETAFTLKKKEIPTRLDDFSFALERILGKGAIHLNLLLIENFKKKLSSFCHMNHKSSDFQEYVKQAKECVENMKNGKERETLIGNTSLDILEDQPEMSAISQEQF